MGRGRDYTMEIERGGGGKGKREEVEGGVE